MKKGIWETDRRRIQTGVGRPRPAAREFGSGTPKLINSRVASKRSEDGLTLRLLNSLIPKLGRPFEPIPTCSTGYTRGFLVARRPPLVTHQTGVSCCLPIAVAPGRAKSHPVVVGGGSRLEAALQSGGGPSQSKTWRTVRCSVTRGGVLECASPSAFAARQRAASARRRLALFDRSKLPARCRQHIAEREGRGMIVRGMGFYSFD